MRFRRRTHHEETSTMSQPPQQYGPQGTPVTIHQDTPMPAEQPPITPPDVPHAAPQETNPAATAPLPGDASVTVARPEDAPVPMTDEQVERALDAHIVRLEADLATAQAKVDAAAALVPQWDHVAGHTLQRGDYDRGNRDGVMACSDDLRAALGL